MGRKEEEETYGWVERSSELWNGRRTPSSPATLPASKYA
jgi:hypothetical protein